MRKIQSWSLAGGSGLRLGLSLQVVSIDDFYLDAAGLDLAMQGNPWGVPGPCLAAMTCPYCWIASSPGDKEQPSLPIFDKSLRQGRGDRAAGVPAAQEFCC